MPQPVVLVHGAFLGAWAWDAVVAELADRGVTATAVDLASRGQSGDLASDADVVRTAVRAAGTDVVLVGQSYGGMVITEASAGLDEVGHLVYVCAALPDDGDTVSSLMATDPHPTTLGEGIRPDVDGTLATLDPDTARALPGHDVPQDVWDAAVPRMGRHQMGTFGEAATALGWREHPSTYVVTTQDTVFSPDLQRTMAARAGWVVEVESSHFPMLSRPAELAEVIAHLAG